MQLYQFVCAVLVLLSVSVKADDKSSKKVKKLQIGVKKRVDPDKCTQKSKKGDTLHMHYTVSDQLGKVRFEFFQYCTAQWLHLAANNNI